MNIKEEHHIRRYFSNLESISDKASLTTPSGTLKEVENQVFRALSE